MNIVLAIGYLIMAASAAFSFMVVRFRQISKGPNRTSEYLVRTAKSEAIFLGSLLGAMWPFTLPIALPIFLGYHGIMKIASLAESVAESKS